MFELFKAILLGVVEGVTEFLPISSTGHLVICERWLAVDLENDPFWKMFAIFIQIGAIAAVVVYFRHRLLDLLRGRNNVPPLSAKENDLLGTGRHGDAPAAGRAPVMVEPEAPARVLPVFLRRHHALAMILVGSLPLGIAFLAYRWAEQNLESPMMIAAALGIGGVLMILIEQFRPAVHTTRLEQMNWRQALGIGLAQIVAALFPGTSRSAATIMGGELAGLSRPAAAEFSFFLAIPAMTAACGFSLMKHIRDQPPMDLWHVLLLAVGTIVSFVVAWAVIAAFMSFIRRHSFVPFAIYRIGVAMVVLLVFR